MRSCAPAAGPCGVVESGLSGGNTVQREGPTHRPLLIGLLVALAAAALFTVARLRSPADPRHVIMISLDTTRADHLGCYGNRWIRTPNIDALAGESIILADFLTAATTTLASHTSLFTGKYPHSHGVPRNGFRIDGRNVMIPEIFRDAGFTTVGFIGSFALDKRFGFAQGFAHFDQDFDIEVGRGGYDQNQRSAEKVTDAVIRYLGEGEVPERLFLFVHYFDPHMPYSPPPPYNTMYDSILVDRADGPKNHPAWLPGKPPLVSRRLLSGYAGEISYMDKHVGRLLDFLRRRGILDDAVLVMTSDHGENFGDAPGGLPFYHGLTVYEPEARVAGLIRLPNGRHGGTRHEGVVGSVDILPTLVRFFGLPVPEGIDGKALDLNKLKETPRGACFSEATQPREEVEVDSLWFNARKARCVRLGKMKYIETLYVNREELFDLSNDPNERRNLLAGSAGSDLGAGDLRALLSEWDASARPLPTEFDQERKEETMRRLRALGYLGRSGDGEGREE